MPTVYDDGSRPRSTRFYRRQAKVDEKPRQILSQISLHEKSRHQRRNGDGRGGSRRQRQKTGTPLRRIRTGVEAVGALDFDDLLLRTVEVLKRFGDARASGGKRFAGYLRLRRISGHQPRQYDLLRHRLAGERPNLRLFRRTEIQYRLSLARRRCRQYFTFLKGFPGAKVLRRAKLPLAENIGCRRRRRHQQQNRIGKQMEATRGAGNC